MEKIYTVKEAAKILGFSTNTLYKYLENGAIEAARGVGKQARFRIPHSSLESYLGTKLPEDQVLKVVNPHEFAKLQAVKEQDIELKKTLTPVPDSLPLTVTRLLIIASLVFFIVDLLVSDTFSLTSTLLRMGLISAFILLAYQFGGFVKSS